MVRALRDWTCRLRNWWDTACEVCLAVREILMAMTKISYTLALLAGMYVILMWTFDTQVPWEILGTKVLTPWVKPGEAFKVILDVNKVRNCQGFVTRSLGGACGNVDITTVPTTLGIGQIDYEVHMRVPNDVPIGGICIARIRVDYSCNAWQTLFPVTFTLPEIPFQVRAGPLHPGDNDQ